jgi:hypothetical protein
MTGKDAEAARGILAHKGRDLLDPLCMSRILKDQRECFHCSVSMIVPRI